VWPLLMTMRDLRNELKEYIILIYAEYGKAKGLMTEIIEPELKDVVMTKKRFQTMIEDVVLRLDMNYLDSIIYLCEKYTIEPEDCKKYISPVIKGKLEADAKRLRYIQQDDSVLPIE
jgi:hypothetical protein